MTQSNGEHVAKKARTEMEIDEPTTLHARLTTDGYYATLPQLSRDLDAVCTSLLSDLPTNNPNVPKVHAFKDIAQQLIQRTSKQYPGLTTSSETDQSNGIDMNMVTSNQKTTLVVAASSGILYSSLQNSTPITSRDTPPEDITMTSATDETTADATKSSYDESIPAVLQPGASDVSIPLDDASLPSSVHFSRIFASKSLAKVPTLGEAFPAPSRLPQLLPIIPKAKSYSPAASRKNPKSASYPYKTAMWLSYDPFASFAPVTDHLNVTITDDTKSSIWIEKRDEADTVGSNGETVTINSTSNDEAKDNVDAHTNDTQTPIDEEELFKTAVEQYAQASEEEIAAIQEAIETESSISAEAKALDQISELLSNLRNKQYKRLAQHVTVSSISKPDQNEKEIYAAASQRLVELISKLPPHTVARLDGALDEDLTVSTKITFAEKVYKGCIPVSRLESNPMVTSSQSTTQSYPSKNVYGSTANGSSRGNAASYPTPRRTSQTPQPYATASFQSNVPTPQPKYSANPIPYAHTPQASYVNPMPPFNRPNGVAMPSANPYTQPYYPQGTPQYQPPQATVAPQTYRIPKHSSSPQPPPANLHHSPSPQLLYQTPYHPGAGQPQPQLVRQSPKPQDQGNRTPYQQYQAPQLPNQQMVQQTPQQMLFKPSHVYNGPPAPQQQQQQQQQHQQQYVSSLKTQQYIPPQQQQGAPAGVGSGYLAHGRSFTKTPSNPSGNIGPNHAINAQNST